MLTGTNYPGHRFRAIRSGVTARSINLSLSVSLNLVPENSTAGFVVGQATSPEASPTFSLPNDDGGNFAIHASTGQITLTSAGATAFDGQGADTRTITVSDGTSTTGNLSVSVTEVNDAPTVTDKSLTFVVTPPTDVTAPTFGSSTPADGATGVAITTDIAITFSENVTFGTGNITVKLVGGANIEVFDVVTEQGTSPGQVSISGAVLTIHMTADFANSADIAVQIDATAIDDLAGNSFAGIADDTTLNFTTVAAAGGVEIADFATTNTIFANTSLTPSMPSHASGDLLVGLFGAEETADFSDYQGFSIADEDQIIGNSPDYYTVLYKVAASGSEAPVFDLADGADIDAIMIAFSGATTIDGGGTPALQTGGTSNTAPAATGSNGDCVMQFCAVERDPVPTAGGTPPALLTAGSVPASTTEGRIEFAPNNKSQSNGWTIVMTQSDGSATAALGFTHNFDDSTANSHIIS